MNNKYVDTSRLNHIATTNKIVMYQESINKYFSLFGDKSNFCFYNQINDWIYSEYFKYFFISSTYLNFTQHDIRHTYATPFPSIFAAFEWNLVYLFELRLQVSNMILLKINFLNCRDYRAIALYT